MAHSSSFNQGTIGQNGVMLKYGYASLESYDRRLYQPRKCSHQTVVENPSSNTAGHASHDGCCLNLKCLDINATTTSLF